ncbi:hypothetical protein GCK72_007511 [Caenorhabditis remanei]|uniref:Uncharacterized protein n=1 Tax=Caenorhabditis remanei TaxID=31234 RepID=A0A6A5HP26_CAERE|nr:hypothetical protein GCK72_007511 [Caenorhabditis remanei]KAF1767552.1 hypothetical protein GCK72_007511 [Caenorhabditis remanei]
MFIEVSIFGSSEYPECEHFTLGGRLHHQGHVGTISDRVATMNGVNSLWKFNGQGRPRKCWEYTDKEWFLGLLHGDNSENTFAIHGSYINAQTIITSTTNLPDHKNNFFHKYGTKDETGHFCFDELDNRIFATGCIINPALRFNQPNSK